MRTLGRHFLLLPGVLENKESTVEKGGLNDLCTHATPLYTRMSMTA